MFLESNFAQAGLIAASREHERSSPYRSDSDSEDTLRSKGKILPGFNDIPNAAEDSGF